MRVKEQIADDIEELVQFAASELEGTSSPILKTAKRVEAWLATYKPEEPYEN